MKRAITVFVVLSGLIVSGCTSSEPVEERPVLNCRVPVDPTVTVGVGVGSNSGLRVGGGIEIDASGNNGTLDAEGNCILVETSSKVTIGIGV